MTPDAASVVNSRYPDGIPSSFDGRHVARPSTIDREPATDQSFLLGGWSLGSLAYACPNEIGTPPPFGPRCGTPFLAENPLMDEQQRVMLDGPGLAAGPILVQVHRHDPRAADCDPVQQAACNAIAVIEKVVWSGDAETATGPWTPTDTFTRLAGADPNLFQAMVKRVSAVVQRPSGPAGRPTGPACVPPYPTEAWSMSGAAVSMVLVFAATAAREAVDQNFLASEFIGITSTGGTCETITDGLFATTWVAVDNVMVGVQMDPDGPDGHAGASDRRRQSRDDRVLA